MGKESNEYQDVIGSMLSACSVGRLIVKTCHANSRDIQIISDVISCSCVTGCFPIGVRCVMMDNQGRPQVRTLKNFTTWVLTAKLDEKVIAIILFQEPVTY